MSDVYAYFRTTSFPAYLDVSREAGEGARAFRRALNHPNYYGGMDREAVSPPLPVREWDEQLRARG